MNGYYLCLGKPLVGFLGNSMRYKGVDRDKTLYYLSAVAKYRNEVLIDNETDAISIYESIIQSDEFNGDVELVYVSSKEVSNNYRFLGWDVSWDFENSVIAQFLDIPYWQTNVSIRDGFKSQRDFFYKKLNKYGLFNTDKEAKELISVIKESSLEKDECEWLDEELFPVAVYLVRSSSKHSTYS